MHVLTVIGFMHYMIILSVNFFFTFNQLYFTYLVQMILQETPRVKHFGIHRKPLPLEPTVLIREANRRRASLSAGNTSEMFDGRPGFADG